MGKKDSRNLKRKKKLKARNKRQNESCGNLAYHGNKYRSNELVPICLEAETAILECFVISGRSLTDHDVWETLTQMVLDIRHGRIKPFLDPFAPPQPSDNIEDFMVHDIRSRWGTLCTIGLAPSRDTFAGVLRTILGSIETHSSPGANSQGYLTFIEEFLGKCGREVQLIEDEEALTPVVPMLEDQ